MLKKLITAGVAVAALWPIAAQASWHEATSKHFDVFMDDSAEHVKAYATDLEHFDKGIRLLHVVAEDNRGVAGRVRVFVVPNADEVSRVCHNSNALGCYDHERVDTVAFMPRNSGESAAHGLTPRAIMFHEYTHHWMFTNWSDAALPAWYTEGAAELHATAQLRGDGSIVFGAVPEYRSYGVARSDIMPAPLLLKLVPSSRMDAEEGNALYGRGWLLTHYLTFDAERRKLLARYVVAVNSTSIDEAAKVFGNLNELDLTLDAYGKRRTYPSIMFTADQLTIDPVTVRELTPAEAAAMPARIRSTGGVDKAAAPQVAALARAAEAKFPGDAATENELAEAEFDVANTGPEAERAAGYARADAAADRALAADPKSMHALLYKGQIAMARAVAAKSSDPAVWSGVRRWFITANRTDTEDAQPLQLYYESFVAAKQPVPKSAQDGLLYAYALAPHDPTLRLQATRVLLQQGAVPQARVALVPVAYRAELNPATSTRFRKVLDALDHGGAAAALAALDVKDEPKAGDAKTS